jgi:D-alanine-D-alanine ligase
MGDEHMRKKIKVAILFGGRSAEHEVSLESAINVINAIDKDKYEPVLIGIDRQGTWFRNENALNLLKSGNADWIQLDEGNREIALMSSKDHGQLLDLTNRERIEPIDVIFPVLHGPYGEDGSVQGFSRLANVPCVGASILGSAVCMDKDVTKRILREAGIAVAEFMTLRGKSGLKEQIEEIEKKLKYPLFVKPANMGSSVGISRVMNLDELYTAIDLAFKYDTKVLVEQEIPGREIECSVLGNETPIASVPGEIVTKEGFYSYDSKYVDEDGAVLIIPADIEPETIERIQTTALRAFERLECSGMARVDMFLTDHGEIYVNEINSIPGFTRISMYPKLWETSGISYSDLIDRLITLAIEDFERRIHLKTTLE